MVAVRMIPGKSLICVAGTNASRADASARLHSRFRSANHIARDHELLDLAGPLVDAEEADVPIEALDSVVTDIAGAAMNLHRSIGHAPAHFRGKELGARGFGRHVASIV